MVLCRHRRNHRFSSKLPCLMDRALTKTILQKTEAYLVRLNKYFERQLDDTIQSVYKREDGDKYYLSVLDELHQTGYLRYKKAPTVGQEIWWYESADGEPWYWEIPAELTKHGKPCVVNCVCSLNHRDYIIDKNDFPYSY